MSPEQSWRFRAHFPAHPVPAAVLVPLVDHPGGLTVLLTQRAEALRRHGGQISFPGGRIEAGDAGPLAAALRETHEEIGLEPARVHPLGYLPDHVIASGFRVTPVVALVDPGFSLSLDSREVRDTFEVPLAHVFDAHFPARLIHRNHQARIRHLPLAAFHTPIHPLFRVPCHTNPAHRLHDKHRPMCPSGPSHAAARNPCRRVHSQMRGIP